MPMQELNRLRKLTDDLLKRFHGMEREEVVDLLSVVQERRARSTLGRMVRSALGWIGLLATTVGALIGVVTAIRGGLW